MTRVRTVAVFSLVTLLFGTSFPAIEVGLRYFPPLLLGASRYYLSGVLLLGYAVATSSYWRPVTRRDWAAVAAGGVLFIGGTGFTFVGQQFVTSAVAAILVSLTPVLTVLFGWVLLPDERLSRRGQLGVAVGFAGVALVLRPDPSNLLDATVVGKALVLLATVLVTLGTVLVRRARAALPVPALTGWAMLVGATVQLGVGVATGETVSLSGDPGPALATVAYLGVVAGAVAFGLYFWLLEQVGALEANLVTYLTPPVTLAIGSLVLNEPVDPLAVVGFLVIAAGFGLLKERELAAQLARYRGPTR
ncbi:MULTISPECIES: DMT family transporter [Salinibaculum]|uniref:DMT family transporter n=1 Tax=Salinibaculum TaxID=2732368 RepID=UPI0030CE9D88